MGILEYLKDIGNRIKNVGSKLFAEDQFVEYDNREELKTALAMAGMTGKAGAELVRSNDDSSRKANELNAKEEASITLTPADRVSDEAEGRTDSIIRTIKEGVETTGKYDNTRREVREKGGKAREK